MTDTNCLIKKPRCGLQAGNPVCAKCGLDTRVGGYTSQQAGEEARSNALAAWEAADRKEQEELTELEQRKAQEAKRQAEKERQEKEARKAEEAAQSLAQEKAAAEASQRAEQERKAAEEMAQRLAKAGKLKQTAVVVALFISAIGGYSAWEHQKAEAQAQAQAAQEEIQAELEKTRSLAAKAEASQRAAEQQLAQKAKELEQARLDSQRTAAKKESSVAASAAPSAPQAVAPRNCTECPEMVVVPAGSFQMGSNDSEAFSMEKPVHPVNVKSFAIGKYEVTQGQWRAIMGSNPSKFTQCGENCPVDNVSWNDIQTYIQKLNQKTGQRYRLPTEAEWEYACWGGRQQKYCGSDNVGSVAWYDDNSASTTHPVGQKAPNAFGLHDMSGNVYEWVQDRYNKSYDGAPADGTAWEAGFTERVLRGGSWRSGARFTRAAYRLSNSPDDRYFSSGFRLARTVP